MATDAGCRRQKRPPSNRGEFSSLTTIPMSARLLAWCCERGHQAEHVESAAAAQASITANKPDVVLLDIGLPGMDGYELARLLRTDPALPQMTIIAVTGYGQEEDRRRSEEAGINHHLVKPIDVRDLDRILAGLNKPAAKL